MEEKIEYPDGSYKVSVGKDVLWFKPEDSVEGIERYVRQNYGTDDYIVDREWNGNEHKRLFASVGEQFNKVLDSGQIQEFARGAMSVAKNIPALAPNLPGGAASGETKVLQAGGVTLGTSLLYNPPDLDVRFSTSGLSTVGVRLAEEPFEVDLKRFGSAGPVSIGEDAKEFAMGLSGEARDLGLGVLSMIPATTSALSTVFKAEFDYIRENKSVGDIGQDLFAFFDTRSSGEERWRSAMGALSLTRELPIHKKTMQILNRFLGDKVIEGDKYIQDACQKTLDAMQDEIENQFLFDLGSGAASLAIALGLSALTKNPSLASGLFGAIAKGGMYQEAIENGWTPSEATGVSDLSGIIEASLEFLGIDEMTKAFRGTNWWYKIPKGMVTEAIQEYSQTASENLVGILSGFDDRTWERLLEESAYSALIGAILGGGAGGVSGLRQRPVVESMAQKLKDAGETNETIDEFKKAFYDDDSKAVKDILRKTYENVTGRNLSEAEKILRANIPDEPLIDRGVSYEREAQTIYRGQPKDFKFRRAVSDVDASENILIGKGVFATSDIDVAKTYGENVLSFKKPTERVLDISNAKRRDLEKLGLDQQTIEIYEDTLKRKKPQTILGQEIKIDGEDYTVFRKVSVKGETQYELEPIKYGRKKIYKDVADIEKMVKPAKDFSNIKEAEDILINSIIEKFTGGVSVEELLAGGSSEAGKLKSAKEQASKFINKKGFDFVKHQGGIRAGRGQQLHDVYIALSDEALQPQAQTEAQPETTPDPTKMSKEEWVNSQSTVASLTAEEESLLNDLAALPASGMQEINETKKYATKNENLREFYSDEEIAKYEKAVVAFNKAKELGLDWIYDAYRYGELDKFSVAINMESKEGRRELYRLISSAVDRFVVTKNEDDSVSLILEDGVNRGIITKGQKSAILKQLFEGKKENLLEGVTEEIDQRNKVEEIKAKRSSGKTRQQLEAEWEAAQKPDPTKMSKEEWVKAHGFKVKPPKKIYRGVMDSGKGAGTYSLGKGLYSTPDKGYLKGLKFDKIVELSADEAFPRNPIVFRNMGNFQDWLLEESGEKNIRKFNEKYKDPADFVKSKGYDGVILEGQEIVKYDNSKTIQQLESEWEAAQGATQKQAAEQALRQAPLSETPQARANSIVDFIEDMGLKFGSKLGKGDTVSRGLALRSFFSSTNALVKFGYKQAKSEAKQKLEEMKGRNKKAQELKKILRNFAKAFLPIEIRSAAYEAIESVGKPTKAGNPQTAASTEKAYVSAIEKMKKLEEKYSKGLAKDKIKAQKERLKSIPEIFSKPILDLLDGKNVEQALRDLNELMPGVADDMFNSDGTAESELMVADNLEAMIDYARDYDKTSKDLNNAKIDKIADETVEALKDATGIEVKEDGSMSEDDQRKAKRMENFIGKAFNKLDKVLRRLEFMFPVFLGKDYKKHSLYKGFFGTYNEKTKWKMRLNQAALKEATALFEEFGIKVDETYDLNNVVTYKGNTYTKNSLMGIYAIIQSERGRANINKGYEFDADFLSKITDTESLLTQKEKDYVLAYMDLMTQYFVPVDETLRKTRGMRLGFLENYFPHHIIKDKDVVSERSPFEYVVMSYPAFTKKAKGLKAGQKLSLDFHNIVSTHIDKTIDFITLFESIQDMDKLFRNKKIKSAIRAIYGDAGVDLFGSYIQNLKNPREKFVLTGDSAVNKLLGNARKFVSISSLVGNLVSITIQSASFSYAIPKLGFKNAMAGMDEFLTDLPKNLEFVKANSVEMENRSKSFDRERMALYKELENSATTETEKMILDLMFAPQKYVDMTTAGAVWWAQYQKSMRETKGNHDASVFEADELVRTTQPTSRPQDLPPLMAQGGVFGLFTSFYGPFSLVYNNFMQAVDGVRFANDDEKKEALKRLLSFIFYSVIMSSFYTQMLRRGFKGYDSIEDWSEGYVKELTSFSSATIPGLSHMVNFALYGFGTNLPALSALESIPKAVKSTIGYMQDETDLVDVIKSTSRAVGSVRPFPGTMVSRFADGLNAIYFEGDDEWRRLFYSERMLQ